MTPWNNDLCVWNKRDITLKVGHMVEKRRTSSSERNRGNMRSPHSLPPRWGEGVAPPTTPYFTQENTPETSPRTDLLNEHRISSPDSDYNSQPGSLRASTMPRLNHPSASYPSTGAELLEDLHRRLQAQSINGTLPRRPKTTSLHRHRKIRKSRHKINCIPQPDLLPTSAFNHPSRHTQYHLVQLPSSSSSQNLQPQPTSHTFASLSNPLNEPPTSDYSPSPSTSESPPLPATSLPLSYPSPPILRRLEKQPLTSTMLASPPDSPSSGSHITTGHPTSPASPEISSIPLRPQDRTTYQNIENGIVYITAEQAQNIQRASSSSLPVRSSVANLSRFNVSPPHIPNPTVPGKSGIRLPAKNKLKTKTVSWVADRKVKAKNISEDRKIVKSQVQIE